MRIVVNRYARLALALLSAYISATPVCAAQPASAPARQTFILHLPGIGGLMRIDKLLTGGLKKGGLETADVTVYDWTSGNPGLPALGAIDRNKREA